MSQYANLKAAIAANVYQNHNNEVTANMVKAAMNAMTDSLGAGYQYLGIATPTSPGTAQTPDQKVFYIATTPGTYTYLGGLVVNDGEVAILKWDTAWHKEVTGAATAAQVAELGQEVVNIDDITPKIALSESLGDFYLADSNGNVIAEFKDGHIITEKFNSGDIFGDIFKSTEENTAFYITDNSGNVIVEFKDGNIITENFDSRQIGGGFTKSVLPLNAQTDWISTARNYVLRERTISQTKYLSFSTDCGKTWGTDIENTIGTINFVYWFSDGTCLICTPNSCYWTKDYATLNRSTILETDGTELNIPSEEWHFNVPNSQSSEVAIIEGREYLMWGDYCGTETYSSVWASNDCGHTIQRVLKNNVSVIKDTEGNDVSFAITHIHKVTFDNLHKCYWITTGDYNTGNKLIKAEIVNDDWQFTQMIQGSRAKFVGVIVDEDYLYCVTDYTDVGLHNGLLRCPLHLLGDIDNYEYIWQVPNEDVSSSQTKSCLSNYFQDDEGNRIITGDDGQFNKFWHAYRNFDFREITLVSSIIERFCVHYFVGTNYNGDLIALLTTYGWAGGRDRMGLNRSNRVLISTDFRENGASDFGKTIKIK